MRSKRWPASCCRSRCWIGTGLHYTMRLWQADPVAALAIAAYLVREGYKAWSEQELCC